jgi:GH43 family beta-xylosidase
MNISLLRCAALFCAALFLPGLLPASARPAGTFTNPIDPDGADPFITTAHGWYYLLATDVPHDSFGPRGPHEITVRASRTLGTLGTAKPTVVYNVPVDPQNKNPGEQFYESPELWEFGNHWYLYYTEYPNTVNVLESDTDDPQSPFHFKAALTHNTYDATVLKMPDGALYLLGSTYGSIVIEPLANLYTVSGPQTAIAVKSQGWEQTVIEAPEALWHNGHLTLLYSCGGYNKDNYGVGGLTFLGGDPTLAASWRKLPGPLFRGLPQAHIWCAGVASPFLSPDGKETWFVYSAYNGYDYTRDVGVGHRIIMAQPLQWNPDGTPDMGVPLPPGQPLSRPSGETH